jgi:hypothetical protein
VDEEKISHVVERDQRCEDPSSQSNEATISREGLPKGCSSALVEHSIRESIHVFENIDIADDRRQAITSVPGDLMIARNITADTRSVQRIGPQPRPVAAS